MGSHTFWAIFIIVLVLGITLGIAYTNATITGGAIFDIFKVKEPTVGQPNGAAQTGAVTPEAGCTYQGVLNMLNKCKIAYSRVEYRNNSNVSCNDVCQRQGKTCVQSYAFDEESEITLPYECDWMAGSGDNALICNCCEPSGEAELMGPAKPPCHYWPLDYPTDCVHGVGRWRCDGMCGETGQIS